MALLGFLIFTLTLNLPAPSVGCTAFSRRLQLTFQAAGHCIALSTKTVMTNTQHASVSVQLPIGGWENYVGAGENNVVTAEALWGVRRINTYFMSLIIN